MDKALAARAEAMGLSRDDIEELAIPAYGLTEPGRAVREFDDAGTAELVVQGSRAALTWRNGAGKAAKSVPAAIRQEHPEELKDLKAAAGDIDKMLPALAQRLDRQFAARRTWTYAAWRDRYLDHCSPVPSPAACCGPLTARPAVLPTASSAPWPVSPSPGDHGRAVAPYRTRDRRGPRLAGLA